MTERPILFSAPMVLALLAGTKTQTRRIIKPVQPRADGMWPAGRNPLDDSHFGQPGDRLWVREGVRLASRGDKMRAELAAVDRPRPMPRSPIAQYVADGAPAPIDNWGWKNKALPSIHMPRGVCRLELEVTAVRVERLQGISPEDAIAEGLTEAPSVDGPTYGVNGGRDWFSDPRDAYRALWESINGAGSWAANPWVWVVEFKRVTP